MLSQLIAEEEFVSVQKAQAGLTKIFRDAERKGIIVRLMRNNQPLGVLIPNKVWKRFIELFETLSSQDK